MKPQQYRQILRCESDRAQASRMLQARRLDEPQEIIIRQYVPDHSGAQQRFYREIERRIYEYTGDSPDRMSGILKEKFMVPILLEDNTKTKFHRMFNLLQEYKKLYSYERAKAIWSVYVSELSTKELNMSQMSEFIESCLNFAAEHGIVIETPDELRNRRKTTTDKRK